MDQSETTSLPQQNIKKPKLSSQKTSQKQQKPQMSLEEKIDQIEINMRYRTSTLCTALFGQNYYLSLVKDYKQYATLLKPYLQQQSKQKPKKTIEELVEKIVRQINIISMFFQRANFQIQRQPLLKIMEVDIRTVKNELQGNKEFLEQYDELEADEEAKEWDEKVKDIKPMDPDVIKQQLQKLRIKHNLSPDQHIFFCSNDAQDVAEVLRGKGWLEVDDVLTQVFELKFSLKKRFLFLGPDLQDLQVVNHFPQSKGLTSKYGLSRTMRNCYQICQVDQNEFFPRCYDLKEEGEFEDFLEDFKFTKAESILKNYNSQTEYTEFQRIRMQVACRVTQRRMLPMAKKIQSIVNQSEFPIVYPDEWKILTEESAEPTQLNDLIKRLKIQSLEQTKLIEEVTQTLNQLKKWDVQNQLAVGKNIWVIKPCGLSRGRGVKYYNSLEELLPYVACSPKIDFVAQKGVENLLIINQKKFDIRQWVLVSSLQPLKIWIYEECYVRFCAEDYSLDDLKNKFAHLTNNSVAKYSEQFGKDGNTQGNMWFQSQLADYLKNLSGGADTFAEKIKPQIDRIVVNTIRSAAKTMDNRRNTFDIFGFDLLIDETFSVWLIEVNASPTMGKSTPVTEKLVEMVLHDTGNFILEVIYGKRNLNKVGLWKCIYKE